MNGSKQGAWPPIIQITKQAAVGPICRIELYYKRLYTVLYIKPFLKFITVSEN